MAIADGIIQSVEALLAWIGTGLKQSMADYCDIESVDDEHTITFKDGTLVTIVSLLGSYRMIGAEEFKETDGKISKSLKSYISNGGMLCMSTSLAIQTLPRGISRTPWRPQWRLQSGWGWTSTTCSTRMCATWPSIALPRRYL